MRYLELDEVLRIHERAILQYGGSLGLRDLGAFESSLAVPQQTMFGEDLYPHIVSKTGIFVYLLVNNHPFVDGNKRTGFLCLLRFLAINGYTLDATDDELYSYVIDVATSALDKEQTTEWIEQHLQSTQSSA